jgi:hypothetical protein
VKSYAKANGDIVWADMEEREYRTTRERDDLATELHRVNELCNELRNERDEAIAIMREQVDTMWAFLARMEVKP